MKKHGDLLIVVLFLSVFIIGTGIAVAGNHPNFVSEEQGAAIETLMENSTGNFSVRWNKRKKIVSFISGGLTGYSQGSKEKMAFAFIKKNKVLLGIKDPGGELAYDRSKETPIGHFIYHNQKSNGINVIGGKIIVRVDKSNNIATIANHIEPNISVSIASAISKERAINISESAVNLTGKSSGISLVILPWEGTTHLAYEVNFEFVDNPKPARYRVYLDANDGAVILVENRIMDNAPATGTGIGMDGVLKSFDTYEIGGNYVLGNFIVPAVTEKVLTRSANNSSSLPGSLLTDTDNYWEDPAAIDAHFYGNYVVDFYKDNFGSISWYNNSGFKNSGGLYSTVHYKTAYDNAFWDGRQMVYGDGDVLFYPLSGALDVVAHEITHGVTEAINNLAYCSESGALNESWSDVMGMIVSIEYGDDRPYWSAEGIMKIAETQGYEAYYALRRLDDPPFRTDVYSNNDYNPSDPLGSWGQPEHTSEQYIANCNIFNDYGGVHVNSGIPNKAAYLITEEIGFESAKQIYYYAMFYLSATSQFTDARNALEQAAIDIYGSGLELVAVQNAFDSVGIQ